MANTTIDPADPPYVASDGADQPTLAEFVALAAENASMRAKLATYEDAAQSPAYSNIKRVAEISGTPVETLRRRCERGVVDAKKDDKGRWLVNVIDATAKRFQLARFSSG